MRRISFRKPKIRKLRKKGYNCVDLHYHTVFSDGSADMDSVIQKLKKLKIGVAVTDHNDIRAPLKLCRNKSIFAIPAIEVTSRELIDFLVYFYNLGDLKEFYRKHIEKNKSPNIGFNFNRLKLSTPELIDAIRNYDNVSAIAHPFMGFKPSYNYFRKEKELLRKITAVEVINSSIKRWRNRSARVWTRINNKPFVGGSDGHIIEELGNVLTTSYSHNIDDFLEDIKTRQVKVIGREETGFRRLITDLKVLKNNLTIRPLFKRPL